MDMDDDMSSMNMDDSDDNSSGMMMMQMVYYWGSNVTILFSSWNTEDNIWYYTASLLILFLFALFSEAWSAISVNVRSRVMKKVQEEKEKLKDKTPKPYWKTIIGNKHENLEYLLGAIFYTVKLILGYQLMLAVMTYNVGISIAIFSGAFIGNFIFARFIKENEFSQIDDIACHL